MRYRFLLAGGLFFALFISYAYPQATGTIAGTVTDPAGEVVPGATVSVTQEGTNFRRSVLTDDTGRFNIRSLHPSQYTVTVEMPGFKTYVQPVTLLVDQTLTLTIRMELGEVVETVTVEGLAVRPDRETPTLSQVIEERRMVDLPLDGRNAATLTLLVAGATDAPNQGADQGNTKTPPGAVTISANGARANQVSYRMDGGNYNDSFTNVNQPFPFPDALQEFSVQTSNYSAQFGQNAGAVVNVVTKSGTNAYHGRVFGFHRNKSLNARNFFAAERDPLKRTQFGGTFGGPIVKDKTLLLPRLPGDADPKCTDRHIRVRSNEPQS